MDVLNGAELYENEFIFLSSIFSFAFFHSHFSIITVSLQPN